MANSNLTSAKNAKNDEFYTQYHDIEKEINAYLDFNPDVFRGKTILLPCDDPEWSNFTKFFAQNFEHFGLKKLISTSYAPASKLYQNNYQPTPFETENPQFDKKKTVKNGKIFTLDHDKSGDGKIDVNDLEWSYLKGNGDFKSDEIKTLRDEADIIITNPPFSLFREFLPWLMEANKQFCIIGNMNSIGLKELFGYIKENKVWLGVKSTSQSMYFKTSNKEYANRVSSEKPEGSWWRMIDDEICIGINNSCWFTNLDHGRRHQPMPLMTEADIIKYSTKKPFIKYENYNAIEVSLLKNIPSDYEGIMGVPITFIEKYNPDQFEIVGMCENLDLYNLKTKIYSSKECKEAYFNKFGKTGTYDLNASGVVFRNNQLEKVYTRVLIKHKNIAK